MSSELIILLVVAGSAIAYLIAGYLRHRTYYRKLEDEIERRFQHQPKE